MKRKLDDVDWSSKGKSKGKEGTVHADFDTFGLDARLLQAIGKLNYAHPTPVQACVIPPALDGKDILGRAKTGSGKTAAYLLPILHKILVSKQVTEDLGKKTTALLLVPTRELADQVMHVIDQYGSLCGREIQAVNIARNVSDQVQQSLLLGRPDIVVTTPSRAITHANTGTLNLSTLKYLVIDEADLILSYDHGSDMHALSSLMPKGLQTFMMSATLTDDIEKLKDLFCRHPFVYQPDQKEENQDENALDQYYVSCGEDVKFLLLYVICKLKLIKGKMIVFVADVDRCYRLRLFLEQFGIRACVLNSELPVNSRLHIVDEFNKNVYEIVIATDENEILGDEEDERDGTDEVANPELEKVTETEDGKTKSKKKKKKKQTRKRDNEYGVSRGVDFQNVTCVLNFDLPVTPKSYMHRIGRTARAGKSGMALAFSVPKELYGKHRPTSIPSAEKDEYVLEKIKTQQEKMGHVLMPYKLNMKDVEAFRYRMDDALRAVTKIAVQNARTKELRQELLASEKLKRHFEENPEDLKHLRHDREIRTVKLQSHLKRVPDYLVAKNAISSIGQTSVPFKVSGGRNHKVRRTSQRGGKRTAGTRHRTDPLKQLGRKKIHRA